MKTARVHFCLKPSSLHGKDWVYLGKSVRRRSALERRFGKPPLPLGSLLHEEARRLRGPFLDWVAEEGRAHGSDAGWWAGTFSWKPWAASDLFLLLCYLAVCARLAERPGELAVVVEDPWLLREARGLLGANKYVSFGPMPALWPRKLQAALLSIARRAGWAMRMLRSRLVQALRSRGRRPILPDGPAVLIYSYVLEHCFAKPGEWDDYYMPGFDRELGEAGLRVLRCTDPDATGFEEELSSRSGFVIPLSLFAPWGAIFRAAFSLPVGTRPGAAVAGLPVGLLAEREWWQDLSKAGRCSYFLLKRAADRLLVARPWRALVMPWEAQPQEKMLVLAARERGIRTVGYQHATVSPWQLPHFLGKGEAELAPFPDVLLTSGARQTRTLAEGGVPEPRLRLGGSRRFAGMAAAPRLPESPLPPDILVILPIYFDLARYFLAALGRAYPAGGDGFSFVVKPHPAELRPLQDLTFPAKVVKGTVAPAARSCGLVVFTGTAGGLEAVALGRPVLRYRPDALMDIDPCDVLSDEVLPTAGDADLKEKLEALRRSPRIVPAETARAAFEKLFAPVDKKTWKQAIER